MIKSIIAQSLIYFIKGIKMGKKIIIISLLLLILLVPASLFAEIGAGIVLGEPTGLSFKSGNLAVGLGWSFASKSDNRIDASIDWWLINEDFVGPLNWYLGVGTKIGLKLNQDKDIFNIGLRIPIGIQMWPVEKLELFLEIAPGILLIPGTDPDISGGIGLRYYFQN